MPKKNHHFVPQFYLRNFSKTGRSVSLVNIVYGRAIENASIAGQCYRPKFYGEDNQLEDLLQVMEDYACRLFKSIIRGGSVPRGSRDHKFILDYLAVQLLRTRRAHERIARMASLTQTYLLREMLAYEGKKGDDQQAVVKFGAGYPLKFAEDFSIGLRDLDFRVLRVTCEARFITSDVPVAIYNQWCEGVDFMGVLGASCSGLQMFFPLSPSCLLMWFDEAVYAVEGESGGDILVSRPQDVYRINRLQSVFAQENLYFSEWNDRGRILAALPKSTGMRQEHQERLSVAREVKQDSKSATVSELLHEYEQMPNTNLKISFSSFQRQARRVPLLKRAQQWRYADTSRFKNYPPEDDDAEARLKGKRFRVQQNDSWTAEMGNLVP